MSRPLTDGQISFGRRFTQIFADKIKNQRGSGLICVRFRVLTASRGEYQSSVGQPGHARVSASQVVATASKHLPNLTHRAGVILVASAA